MQTDLIPPGIESLDGGGTIIVNVFDANVQPVAGATIHVYNDTFTPAINDTYYSDTNGQAVISGVSAGSNYQLRATLPGYSTDQTYIASSTNPVPARPPLSVAAGEISTLYFQIDELSDLTVETIGPPVKAVFSDGFDSDTLVATTTDTTIAGGSVVLAGDAGGYVSSGMVYASATIPATLDSWESFDFNATTTENTELHVSVYSASGYGSTTTFTRVPDSDLPGNSTGFTEGPVNITSIDASVYPRLSLGALLFSSSTAETPELYDWSLTHIASESAIPNVPFTLTGTKTIGRDAFNNPVFKYQQAYTTDGAGSLLIPDLEFDGYSFDVSGSGYTISEIIGGDPYEKKAGVDETVTLILNGSVPYSLRVTVNDTDNNPIAGASVRVYDGASYDSTQETSIYGQSYFGSGLASTTYTIDVSASGYNAVTIPVEIHGNVETQVQLVAVGESGGGGTPPPTSGSYLAGYNTRIPLSINGSTLFGSVTDFPVYVDLSDLPNSFFSSVQSTGADIRITEEDGITELPFELVDIDTGSRSGQLYFKASSLDVGTTEKFYMYF